MGSAYEDKMTWPEICEQTIKKLSKSLGKDDEVNRFRKWFMEREVVGYRFDPIMIFRCYNIWKDLNKDYDHFVVLCGREGSGKTTFGSQIASWIYPKFRIDNIVYGTGEYLKALKAKMAQYKAEGKIDPDVIMLDEGTELLSRESLNESNRILTKTFFVQRALKCLVIINIPNFHMLDAVVRKHRVKTLIEVTERGRYKAIVGVGIPIVAKDGERQKTVSNIKLPYGSFWEGYFQKDFPKTLDFAEYSLHKMNGIDNLLETLDKNNVDVNNNMIESVKIAKVLGKTTDTVVRWINEKRLDGNKLGGRYYIVKNEKLTNMLNKLQISDLMKQKSQKDTAEINVFKVVEAI